MMKVSRSVRASEQLPEAAWRFAAVPVLPFLGRSILVGLSILGEPPVSPYTGYPSSAASAPLPARSTCGWAARSCT